MAANSIEILSNINKTVSFIATTLNQKADKKEAGAISSLSKGDVSVKTDGAKGSGSAASILGNPKNTEELIKALGDIPVEISKVAKLDGATMKKFDSVITKLTKGFTKLTEYMEKHPKAVDDIKKFGLGLKELSSGLKTFIPMIALGPIAAVGAALTYPVILLSIGLFKLIQAAKIKDETYKNVKNLTSGLNDLTGAALKASLLIGICMGMGLLIQAGGKDVLINGLKVLGVVLLSLVGIVLITGLATRVIKSLGAIKGINTIMNVMFKVILLLGICIGIGAIINSAGGRKLLINGLIVMGAVLLAMVAIIFVVGMATRLIKSLGAISGLRDIMIFAYGTILLLAICVGLGYVITQPKVQKALLRGLLVLGLVLLSMVVIILIAGLASKVIKSVGAIKALGLMLIITYASIGLIIAAKYLGDFVTENLNPILIGLASMAGVLLGLVAIGWLASVSLKTAKKGLIALGVLELLAAGAAGLIYGISVVAERGDEVGWDNMLYCLLMMGGVVLEFGVLAGLASLVLGPVLLGSIAIAAIEILAVGATMMIGEIIEMVQKKDDYGIDWGDIIMGATMMGLVVLELGALAGIMALLTIPLLIAMPAIAITSSFAHSMLSIVNGVADLSKKIDEAGGIDRLKRCVQSDMPTIIRSFNKSNFDLPMSIWDMWRVIGKVGTFRTLVDRVSGAMIKVADMAKAAGVVTEDGQLRPFYGLNANGDPVYGDPVDIKAMSKLICEVMQIFVENLNYGMEDVKSMLAAGVIAEVLGMMADPVTKFVDMLTCYQMGAKDGELVKIRFNEDGSVNKNAEISIPVADVARAIVGAISAFTEVLYDDKNADLWFKGVKEVWYKDWHGPFYYTWERKIVANDRSEAIKNMAGILELLVDPVAKFADLVSKFQPGSNGTLKRISVGQDGSFNISGEINVKAVATSIVHLISDFVKELYGDDSFLSNNNSAIDKWINNEAAKALADGLNGFVGFAEKMSADKINTKSLESNSKAVLSFMTGISNNIIFKLSTDELKERFGVFNSFMETFTSGAFFGHTEYLNDWVNSETVSAINDLTVSLGDASGKLVQFKKDFKAVDDLIVKEADKRKKAIKDTTGAIEELISKITGAHDSISDLDSLLRRLEYMNTDAINRNSRSFNPSFNFGSSGSGNMQGESGSGNGQGGSTKINYDAIRQSVSAGVKDALGGMSLQNNMDISLSGSSIEDKLVELISKLAASEYSFING